MSDIIFSQIFSTLLEQDEAPTGAEAAGNMMPPEEAQPTADDADALTTPQIDPEDAEILKHAASRELRMIQSLKSWIEKLDDMVEYLNGTSDKSIQMN